MNLSVKMLEYEIAEIEFEHLFSYKVNFRNNTFDKGKNHLIFNAMG